MSIRVLLLLVIIGLGTVRAESLNVIHVFTGWRDRDSFKRISEYFTERENTGGKVILRSQPEVGVAGFTSSSASATPQPQLTHN